MSKTIQLGGELEPANGDMSRVKAQTIFLNTIEEIAPIVLHDLQDRPLQLFVTAGLAQQPFHVQHQVYSRLKCGAHRSLHPRVVRLYMSLLAWAKKHHIESQWCLERAYYSLMEWQLCPPEERTWTLAGSSYVASLPPNPPLGLSAYEPRIETRASYLEYVAKEVERQIDIIPLLSLTHKKGRASVVNAIVRSKAIVDYYRAVEKCARMDGCKKPPVKPQLLEHMKWAVRVRVLGQSWNELSEELKREPRSVQKAVKDALLLVDLPLAPTFKDKKGRPLGKRDIKPRHVAQP